MSNFANVFKNAGSRTLTENGALAYNRTGGGALLDLFANIGGMRKREDADIIAQWRSAYNENPELAANLILYARNIRDGGLGERRIARLLLKELAILDPEKVKRNLNLVANTGRWDDLFTLIGTNAEFTMWDFLKQTLVSDVEKSKKNAPITLLAKWMPSINTSSNDTRKLAHKVCKVFELTPRTYRKTLSMLRRHIDIVERKMSAGKWDEINFEQVPSLAMKRYIKSFNSHCLAAFNAYKAKLVKGEAKVNAATLYPYDIVQPYITSTYSSWRRSAKVGSMDVVAEEQWKALPNYVNGEYDILCVCDTSGSMTCDNYRPLSTAVGLGTYFAQRNKGAYHNMFMTFSSNPTIQTIEDHWNLAHCLNHVMKSDWGMSTDLDKSFALVYDIAKATRDVPRALVIISDMEIDNWMRDGRNYAQSISEKWARKFEEIGLKSPKLIYWNVESRHGNTLSQCTENVGYVSGQSAGTFKFFTELIEKSAYEAMKDILTRPEFSWK